MKIVVRTNFPDVQRALERLRDDVASKVMARAINRTMDQAKTAMSKENRAEFNVSAATVRERLRIKRASFRGGALGLSADLSAGGRRSANVIRFGAKQYGQGVSVKIKKRGARKTIKGTFIGNKGRTVFERVPGTTMRSRKGGGKHAEQIKPVQTIDVPQMFNTRRINAAVVAAMRARFPAIFERELAYAMAQWSKAA